ncbi:MAG TPA: Hsp70 family protein, partial [Pirellulaceae bacterium]|nr:Hsp70 family protein [Pirellulaceae bacterium]
NEPTAAALAYGVHNTGQNESCLVYDLGGGTFDVTVVRITPQDIVVLATDGDHELGGKDWDDRVAQFLATRFRDEYGFDPLERTDSFQDLLVQCEQAKQALSNRASVNVSLDFEGRRGTYPLTREKFEELTVDLMERTQRLTEQTLADAGLTWRDLTSLLLVGGSTRMPMVRAYCERMSGKTPRTGVNVDEAVALGAAVQAALDMQSRTKTRRALPGARQIQDVMSHSLGVVAEAPDRSRYINTKIIEKNKQIPAADKRPYQLRTRSRGDNFWEVYVTQGESDDPSACAIIGKYRLSDITHVPGKDLAVLDIQYEYDRNGVVAITASERSTGKPLRVAVEPLPADMSWLALPPQNKTEVAHATIYLAFDLSGSMSGAPLAEAQKAARGFVEQIDLAHNSVGLISFADICKTTVNACQDAKKLNKGIKSLT